MSNTPYDTLREEWKEISEDKLGKVISSDTADWFIEKMKARDLALREELTHCKKLVENGQAICGCKLDCHLHDWRQRDRIEALREAIEGGKLVNREERSNTEWFFRQGFNAGLDAAKALLSSNKENI